VNIVLVPGLMASAWTLDSLRERLEAEGHKCYWPDAGIHGYCDIIEVYGNTIRYRIHNQNNEQPIALVSGIVRGRRVLYPEQASQGQITISCYRSCNDRCGCSSDCCGYVRDSLLQMRSQKRAFTLEALLSNLYNRQTCCCFYVASSSSIGKKTKTTNINNSKKLHTAPIAKTAVSDKKLHSETPRAWILSSTLPTTSTWNTNPSLRQLKILTYTLRELGRAVVIGHSWGGLQGVTLALADNPHLAAVIGLGTPTLGCVRPRAPYFEARSFFGWTVPLVGPTEIKRFATCHALLPFSSTVQNWIVEKLEELK